MDFLRKSTTWTRGLDHAVKLLQTESRRLVVAAETYREAPVHPQVDGDQQDVFGEDVHLLGPAADGRVAAAAQLGVEESAEGVDGGQAGLGAALHQQVHVEVDHLGEAGWTRFISREWFITPLNAQNINRKLEMITPAFKNKLEYWKIIFLLSGK